MLGKIRTYWETKPIIIITFVAAVLRLLAAVFSKGYGMHDDHFQIIEIAQAWVDGKKVWLDTPDTIVRSLIYPGIHYLLFAILEKLGITDPQIKMTFVRVLHALYSILVVIFGFFLTRNIADLKTARKVGILLATFWILPFMSVRNLVEVVCIPPMIIGFYFAMKKDVEKNWFIAGILFGISFIIRYQVLVFIGGVGLVLLSQKKLRMAAIYTVGILVSTFLIEGVVNIIVWKSPVNPFINFILDNIKNRYNYITGPWYNYLLLILIGLIPPVSFFLFYGILRSWKQYALLFWPIIIFLILHSYFPNKQERFILPILPLIIILGTVGWQQFVAKSVFWQKRIKWLKASWVWFWILNIILLIPVTFTYSKKNRVETLYYLSSKKDITGIVWESHHKVTPFIPIFYLNQDVPLYKYPATKSSQDLRAEIDSTGNPMPNYIIFLGEKEINKRILSFQQEFNAKLTLETEVNPSLIDAVLYWLNPKGNVNQVSFIYKIL